MPETQVASFGKRFWAAVIDQFILFGISILVFVIFFVIFRQQIGDVIMPFVESPIFSNPSNLSDAAFDAKFEAIASSQEVGDAARALAWPFAAFVAISLALEALYFIAYTTRRGATPGKKFQHISVRSLLGDQLPTWGQSALRYFLFIGLGTFPALISIIDLIKNKAFEPSSPAVEWIGNAMSLLVLVANLMVIIMVYRRADKRGFHDLAADTIVVQESDQKK